jgi:hypothetical protein
MMTKPKKQERGAWVLRETLATKKLGMPIWFRQMTGIGPMTTANIEEAARFDSPEEAKLHPANFHWASFYEAEEVKR